MGMRTMDSKKMYDRVNNITDELQHEAEEKLAKEQAYYGGYIQACEDFGRRMRMEIAKEAEE